MKHDFALIKREKLFSSIFICSRTRSFSSYWRRRRKIFFFARRWRKKKSSRSPTGVATNEWKMSKWAKRFIFFFFFFAVVGCSRVFFPVSFFLTSQFSFFQRRFLLLVRHKQALFGLTEKCHPTRRHKKVFFPETKRFVGWKMKKLQKVLHFFWSTFSFLPLQCCSLPIHSAQGEIIAQSRQKNSTPSIKNSVSLSLSLTVF